jgi:hypothetical protein
VTAGRARATSAHLGYAFGSAFTLSRTVKRGILREALGYAHHLLEPETDPLYIGLLHNSPSAS